MTVTVDAATAQPVTDLQPYLGASATWSRSATATSPTCTCTRSTTRDGPGGPQVRFAVEVPTGRHYRLFLDFQHGDVVRTADVIAVAPPASAAWHGPTTDVTRRAPCTTTHGG